MGKSKVACRCECSNCGNICNGRRCRICNKACFCICKNNGYSNNKKKASSKKPRITIRTMK